MPIRTEESGGTGNKRNAELHDDRDKWKMRAEKAETKEASVVIDGKSFSVDEEVYNLLLSISLERDNAEALSNQYREGLKDIQEYLKTGKLKSAQSPSWYIHVLLTSVPETSNFISDGETTLDSKTSFP